MHRAVENTCREDGELVIHVRQAVQDIVDQELQQLIAKKLRESKVGDLYFVDWLVKVALKEALTSEAVKQAIDSTVKARVGELMKDILTNGLWGVPGPK